MMSAVPKVITLNTKPLSANCAQDGKVNSSSLGVYEPGNKAYTDGATVSEPVIVTSKKHTRTLDGSSNLDTEKVKEREPCSQIINVDTNSPFHIESVYSIQENGHLLSLQGCGNIKKAKSRKEQTKNKRAFSESFIIPESCESDPKLSADVKVKVRRLEIGSGNVANVSWTNALAATPCNNLEIPVTEPNISTGCNQITNIQIKTELDEVNVTELNEVNVEPVEKGVEEVPVDFIDVKSESVENDGFAAESNDVTELNQQKACIEDSTRYAEMIRDIMELDQHPERSYIEDTSHYAEVLRDIIELSQHPEKACMENSTHYAAVLHDVTDNSEVSNADDTVEPVQSKRATECPESVAAKKQKTTNVALVSLSTGGAKATNGINVENSTDSEGYQKGGKEKEKRKSGAKTENKSVVCHGKAVQKSLDKEKKNSKAEGGMKSLTTQTAVSRMSVTRRSSRVVVPNSRFKDMVDPSKKKSVTKADNAVETLQFKGAHENPKVVAGRKQNTTSVAPVPPTTRHAEATNNVKASVESKGYQKGGKEKEMKKTDAKTENKSLGHGISVQENLGNENKNSTAEKGLKSVTQTAASRVTLPAVNVISPSSRVVVFNPGINVISPSSRGVIFIRVSKDVVDPSKNKSVPEQNSSNEGETMRTDRDLAGESSKTVESSVNGIAVVPSEAVLVKTTNEKLREQDFEERQEEEHVDSSVTVTVPEQQSVECPESTNPQSREQDFEQRQQEESLPVTVPVPEQQSVDRECPKLTISQRKPVRYCVYCKKTIFGGKLKRHIISRHKTEIGEILSKPERVQNAFFNLKRREGIYEHNLKSIAEGKELSMRERRSKHRENLSVCINCKGFFSTQHFNKHKCINKNPHALKPELCQKISDEKMDTDEEFTDILNGIKEVEELCRTETMIKRIGYRHFNLRRHEKGKLNEITEEVMQEMRELGKLFLKFRNICGYERIFEDMFNEDYLPELVGAIQEIIKVEDVTKKRKEKHGQKQIHSIILKSIKTLHDMYTETKLDEKSKEMEKFKLAYTNKICEVYPQTKQYCTENSLEKAGHPDKLSAENAVEQVEEYIVTPVGTASQSLGTNESDIDDSDADPDYNPSSSDADSDDDDDDDDDDGSFTSNSADEDLELDSESNKNDNDADLQLTPDNETMMTAIDVINRSTEMSEFFASGIAMVSSKVDQVETTKGRNHRPGRYCVYCKKTIFGGKLKRHIIRMHKIQVQEVLSKPEHVQNAFFRLKRREGIYEHNLKNIAQGKELAMRERKPKNGDNLRVCLDCKGFYSSKSFYKHKCINKNPQALKPKLLQKISDEKMDTDEEFTDILNGFRYGEVGDMCRTETMIKRIGYRHFNLRRHGRGKQTDVRKETMMVMRLLSRLFLKFRDICESEKTFEDMFHEYYLPQLEEAIQEIVRVEDHTEEIKEKHGLRHLLHNIIYKSINILYGLYAEAKLDEKRKEIKNFKVAYRKSCRMYLQTIQKCAENSMEKARGPDELSTENIARQVEEDIGTPVEEDIGTPMEEDIGTQVEEDIGTQLEEDIGTQVEEDIGMPEEEDIGTQLEEDIDTPVEEDIGTPVEEDIGTQLEEDTGTPVEEDIGTPAETACQSLETNGQLETVFFAGIGINNGFLKLFPELKLADKPENAGVLIIPTDEDFITSRRTSEVFKALVGRKKLIVSSQWVTDSVMEGNLQDKTKFLVTGTDKLGRWSQTENYHEFLYQIGNGTFADITVDDIRNLLNATGGREQFSRTRDTIYICGDDEHLTTGHCVPKEWIFKCITSGTILSVEQFRKDTRQDVSEGEAEKAGQKSERKRSKKLCCIYCETLTSKLARHLECKHASEPEVAKALSLPKKSRERKRIWAHLAAKGSYAHNLKVKMNGTGVLIRRFRSKIPKKEKEYLPCEFCNTEIVSANLWRHHKRCPGKPENVESKDAVKNSRLLVPADCQGCKQDKKKVGSKMREDIIGNNENSHSCGSVSVDEPESTVITESTDNPLETLDDDNDCAIHKNTDSESNASNSTIAKPADNSLDTCNNDNCRIQNKKCSDHCVPKDKVHQCINSRLILSTDNLLERGKIKMLDLVRESGAESSVGSPEELREITIDNMERKQKRLCCVYCEKLPLKLARHLENKHSSEPEVARALSLPKKSKERLRIWAHLAAKGSYVHNLNVKMKGSGVLITKDRSRIPRHYTEYLPCEFCNAEIIYKYLWRHHKTCPARPANVKSKRPVKNSRLLLPVECQCSKRYKKEVISKMREDIVGNNENSNSAGSLCVDEPNNTAISQPTDNASNDNDNCSIQNKEHTCENTPSNTATAEETDNALNDNDGCSIQNKKHTCENTPSNTATAEETDNSNEDKISHKKHVHMTTPSNSAEEPNKNSLGTSDDDNDCRIQNKKSSGKKKRQLVKTPWSEEEKKVVETDLKRCFKLKIVPKKLECMELLEEHPVLSRRSWRMIKDHVRTRLLAEQRELQRAKDKKNQACNKTV
ncbi:uncharacterized protein LOC123557703 isoform X2 [Mercenaria mercenaria]|uniref:uncharacterized protein LOC123557703 isoform X2 n=1 Tax=Mercenaria mercenaria TaxID=6596 RepID=UPI00234F115B|nr:uncharacterized protein LOC123557703 isoform X2 [Mercenaria mercenaria]